MTINDNQAVAQVEKLMPVFDITSKLFQKSEMLLFLYLYLTFLIIKNPFSFIFWNLAVLVTILKEKVLLSKEEVCLKDPQPELVFES